MPRPTRIEYKGAFYHVMNRGRARQTIFHDSRYYESFLDTLKESCERFDALFHAYCLMGNHYHLLLETPKANLGRIMRHVNGIYTQRHNRLRNTDGPLFRGRYKAILVDKDAYLLQLSRYIHRNPIDMKRPLVSRLSDYVWSSFPAYINKAKAQSWLCRDLTYQMLGQKQKYTGYAAYVSESVDEDILRYYNKGNISSVLGSRSFREWVKDETKRSKRVDRDKLRKALQDRPEAKEIITAVATLFSKEEHQIRDKPAGRRKSNSARAFAMWGCQCVGAMSLKQIAVEFGLSNIGSASFSINRIKKEIAGGQWQKQIKSLERI